MTQIRKGGSVDGTSLTHVNRLLVLMERTENLWQCSHIFNFLWHLIKLTYTDLSHEISSTRTGWEKHTHLTWNQNHLMENGIYMIQYSACHIIIIIMSSDLLRGYLTSTLQAFIFQICFGPTSGNVFILWAKSNVNLTSV